MARNNEAEAAPLKRKLTELMAEEDHSDIDCFQLHKKRALYGARQSTYILRGEYYNSLRKKSMNTAVSNESQDLTEKDKCEKKTHGISDIEQAQLD